MEVKLVYSVCWLVNRIKWYIHFWKLMVDNFELIVRVSRTIHKSIDVRRPRARNYFIYKMKSAPWQSSCRAVQDRRTAQANSRHVQRLMNVKPSIDMRKPKALKYKRSRKNKQTVADVSTQEDHKTEYRTTIATTPNTTTKCTTIQNTYQIILCSPKQTFRFPFFFNCQFRNKKHWPSYFFSSIHQQQSNFTESKTTTNSTRQQSHATQSSGSRSIETGRTKTTFFKVKVFLNLFLL